MRNTLGLAALAVIALATAARAEVKKALIDCGGQKLCPSYTLDMTPPDGWVLDEAASAERHAQILVPKGKTFENAPAIIYVQVFYLRDKTQTPADFAKNSNARWLASSPSSTISPEGEVTRANGKPAFLGFAYDNPDEPAQGHELGAFAPDSDTDGNAFMLDVVVTGESAAVKLAKGAYVAWLKGL